MLKSLAPKLIIGGLGIGSVTAGTVYAFLPEKYSHHLNKQGRILLTSNSDKGNEIKKKYDAEGDDLSILVNGQKISDLTKIKEWCSKNSSNTFTNTKDKDYQRVSAGCTEPKTIEDGMKNNKNVLDDKEATGGKENANKAEGTSKIEEYKRLTGNDYLIKEMTNDTTEGQLIQANSLSDATKLRKGCKFSKTKHFKHEEDPRFLKYMKGCVK